MIYSMINTGQRKAMMSKFLKILAIICVFLPLSINAQDQVFSFTESLEKLSIYEKEIIRGSKLDRVKSDGIRQALAEIFNQSEEQLSFLDSQISKKRERLDALLEEPESKDETPDSEPAAPVVVDQALQANK